MIQVRSLSNLHRLKNHGGQLIILTVARPSPTKSWKEGCYVMPRRYTHYAPIVGQNAYRNSRRVGYWLLSCSGMVFGAVVLGGVTRLTESGLSMVTWKLLGEKLPLSNTEWNEEFEKYKQFPEFKMKNRDISLQEFKRIWLMEYAHRMWGRLIGAAFFIPAAVFWYRHKLSSPLKKRITIIGSLIAAQGLMGWYMVKSGLENRFDGPNDVPRVSQYRLASHLSLAFVLYMMLLRGALEKLLPVEPFTVAQKSFSYFKILAHSCKGLVFLTAISGAFVAGLDAGLVYNSFPKMGDNWIPADILDLVPIIQNFFENPTTVQFDHRILGVTTVASITGLWMLSLKYKLPSRVKIATNALVIMANIQISLGITTLLMYVPTPLATSHQSGSLILLSIATWLTQELKHIRMLPRI